jgi:hypothetical protein
MSNEAQSNTSSEQIDEKMEAAILSEIDSINVTTEVESVGLNIHKEKNDYPLTLKPFHVQEILDISRKKTYEFLNEVEARVVLKRKPEFHLVKVGRLFRISRDSFFNWFNGEKKMNNKSDFGLK